MYVEELKDKKEWEAFLQTSSGETFFHSLKWKEAIEKSFSHSALYLAIKDANGTIVGICPGFILNSMRMKLYYSTPYSDYGGPVIAWHCIQEVSLSLRSYLQNFSSNKHVAYAKFCFMNGKLTRSFRSPLSYIDRIKGVVEIDLKATPSKFIWNEVFSKNRRNKIRRIERDGFQAQEARTKSDLRDFYNLYHKNMIQIGAYPYPYRFMENMWAILHPENLRIWLLEKEKRIGGILVFKYGRKTYWVYAGMERDRGFSHYSMIPYLIWKEIEKAEEEGYRYISLGGTPSDPKNPYYIQKMSFGGSFHLQETVWYPLSLSGYIILQTRGKAISTWKAIRNLLPSDLKNIIEARLARF